MMDFIYFFYEGLVKMYSSFDFCLMTEKKLN